MGSEELFISPFELQIAYKLYLGSEKDFEETLHFYELFKEELDRDKLEKYCRELEVESKLNELEEA